MRVDGPLWSLVVSPTRVRPKAVPRFSRSYTLCSTLSTYLCRASTTSTALSSTRHTLSMPHRTQHSSLPCISSNIESRSAVLKRAPCVPVHYHAHTA